MKVHHNRLFVAWLALFLVSTRIFAESPELVIHASKPGAEIDFTRYTLGQGGLSDKPMFDGHLKEVKELRPQTIRIFVQEFFNLYPQRGKFHWRTLDKTIETIRATGARPILSLCFKPKTLFPKIDPTLVHPTDYGEWENLVYRLVKHCNGERKFGIEYWEISNEPDIGEDGGCPYLFQAPDYVIYYEHTARVIRRADAKAKIGGPALAGYNSDIGTLLVEHCGKTDTPLDFFSWHIYNSDPEFFRKSIRDVKAKLARFPKLKNAETIIDEWNMSLDKPDLRPEFQPAFVLETTRIFHEEGLSRSAYYHIRDWFVDERQFSQFLTPRGTELVRKWWNDTPQHCGLFDHHGRMRPAYHVFKLMSLLKGRQITTESTGSGIHALAARNGREINALFWSFAQANSDVSGVSLKINGITKGRFRLLRCNPENSAEPFLMERFGRMNELPTKPIRFKQQPLEIRWLSIIE